MFKKNLIFLRISSMFYLASLLIFAGLFYYVVFGSMLDWNNTSNSNLFEIYFKKVWIAFPILTIVNAVFSFFFVVLIYLHFKFTNNKTYLKYTWICMFNTFVEDFFLIRPIFLIILIIKLWSQNNKPNKDNYNRSYEHINERSIWVFFIIISLILYFSIFLALKQNEAIGWMSFCAIIYIMIPKLVTNSYIDLKFANKKFDNKWIIKFLVSSFFGIFPYCYYLSKNFTDKIN